MKRLFFLLINVLAFANSEAQSVDSSKVFLYRDFYSMVFNNHPLVKQAALLEESAQKELIISKAGFDPKFDFDYTRKVFKGTTYYDYIDNGLKIPLWFGPDIKSGFEKNSGLYVNPTNYTPVQGLWYLGLEVPLGQGMIIDERRATVKQARLALEISGAEKIKSINKILLNAAKDYWEWYFQYHRMKQMELSYQIADDRYQAIKQRVLNGDLAAIDSVEANILVQDRWIEYQKALNDYQNTELILSTYLWTDEMEPLEIDGMIPQEPLWERSINDSTLSDFSRFAQTNHPEIIKLTGKINQLKIDRKLKTNNMLPGISVGLKYLSTPGQNVLSEVNYDYFSNNYKVMVSLSQPLFLRKERGKYQLSTIKLRQAEYDLKTTAREINNMLSASYNDVVTYRTMMEVQKKVFLQTQRLLEGEKQKFDNGESSLFLINSRETKMIESKIKVFELNAKYEKAIAQMYWSAGRVND